MEFDENKAIELINAQLQANGRTSYPDDEILNVIDMIWDYYEENGLLEIDVEDEDDIASEEEIIDYVKRMVKKDKQALVKEEDIPFIVKAEIDYEASLEPF